ncbi:MAG: serine hydrolase [Bacteroidales bacterium]|nr:serine hydrolase [Bacteroidales bacterium]
MKSTILRIFALAGIFAVSALYAFSQSKEYVFKPDSVEAGRWADSVLQTLSVQEKFGQLMTVRVYSNKDEAEYAAIDKMIDDCNIGGVLFFQGDVRSQAALTDRWQLKSKIPLLVSIDGETGLGMRLSDAMRFPNAMTMGAVSDEKTIFNAGVEIGKQCRMLGLQINYAPVADVNVNPRNPVIGSRSFGEKPENVAKKAAAYAKGMQSQGVIAVAKHFPGHGDTETDSHYALPVINHARSRLDDIELYPFRHLIQEGIEGVMLAHLNIPALEAKQKPSSLSFDIGTKLLQDEMGFKGLVMTDGLDMSGVTSYAKAGAVEVAAFLAGNDILLIPPKPYIALDSLVKAYNNKVISEEELNKRCRKVLYYKALYGLARYTPVKQADVEYLLNPSPVSIEQIYREAATVLTNDNAIPLNLRNIHKTIIITYGNDKGNFVEEWKNFGPVRSVSYENLIQSKDSLKNIDVVVAAVFAGGKSDGTYGISQNYINHIRALAQKKKVILVLYASPYSLRLFEHPNVKGFVMGYENQPFATSAVPHILCGESEAKGILPITAGDFKAGDGINIQPKSVLRMALDNEVKINDGYLEKIDSLALLGIAEEAYPGCQILIAKDGKVFYNKSFGTFSYQDEEPVSNETLYDVASLTKIMATTPAIMKLVEQGKISINQTLGHYLPFLKDSDKENIVIKDVLAHQSGLPAWIPFYTKIENSKEVYDTKPSADYSVKIADNMYMKPQYIDTMLNMIKTCTLKPKKYLYSDLGMILMSVIIAKESGMPYEEFLEKEVFSKMNLATIGFHPLERFPKEKIAPTEDDVIWRNQQVQGYVHDMGAAMFGGICGHAGIFANAWDVGAMMQMYLQNGYYNGKQILTQTLVADFTKQQFPLNDNRRGLGFDRPLVNSTKSPVCAAASKSSFGHSGFTGCLAWADPANGLVFVFLSNRICPSSENRKIIDMKLRTLIHQAAYEAIKK